MRNPSAIITALSSLWDRINQWLGRSQAEQAKQQQSEMDKMDAAIQAAKERSK